MEENAKRSAEWRKKNPEAKKAANAARMRVKRAAEKAVKLAQVKPPPTSQLIPSTSKSLAGLLHLCDETPPTLIRKRRPIDFTMADLEAEKSDEDSDGFVANVTPAEKRKMPKRKCTSQNTNNESDDEFEDYIDDLVESAIANEDSDPDPSMIVASILDFIISSVVKPKAGMYKRKFLFGRKSKRAMKSSKYRQFHETDDQYQSRLKKSSALKQDNLKNEERSVRKRRLFRLKQARYV